MTGPVSWALTGGALILAHFWIHPLARAFRESFRWLRKHPLVVIVSAVSIAAESWPSSMSDDARDISYLRWSPLMWECLEKGLHRFAWLFHDVMHRGALYHGACLLLAVVLVYRVKCFEQEGIPLKQRIPTLTFFGVLILISTAFLLSETGWMKLPDSMPSWTRLPTEAVTLAMVQIFYSRLLVDSMIVDHPALPALAETARRWAAVLGLAAFDALALWMDQSVSQRIPLLGRWILPEFLLFISLLPIVVAGTKYPLLHSGGLAVTLLGKLWAPLISIAASGIVLLAWIEFAQLAARDYFPPTHYRVCAAATAVARALAQAWLFVTCGLLLLRSGYLEPDEPPP
jgi:hypothetical protein